MDFETLIFQFVASTKMLAVNLSFSLNELKWNKINCIFALERILDAHHLKQFSFNDNLFEKSTTHTPTLAREKVYGRTMRLDKAAHSLHRINIRGQVMLILQKL